jgi:hypothetical protein
MHAKAYKLDPGEAEAQLADAEQELRGLGHLPFRIEEEKLAIERQFKSLYDSITPAQVEAHHAHLAAKKRREERGRPQRNGRVPSKYLGSLKGAKRTLRRYDKVLAKFYGIPKAWRQHAKRHGVSMDLLCSNLLQAGAIKYKELPKDPNHSIFWRKA